LLIFDFLAIKGWLFGGVVEQEFLEGGEVVGIDKVNAAGEQFLPEGVAGRCGFVGVGPESDAPAFFVGGFDDIF